MATHCGFGNFLDQALRDRFVCGLHHQGTQKRLLSESDLTLTKATEIAHSGEAAEKQVLQFKDTSSAPVMLMNHRVINIQTSSMGCVHAVGETIIWLRTVAIEMFYATNVTNPVIWPGCRVDVSTICRAVNKMGLSRQKITHIALQRSELERVQFIAEMAAFDPTMIAWIDETGCDRRNALRHYGYGIRGMVPQDHQLRLRGVRYSAIGILSMDGVQDVYITENSVNGDIFMDFLYNQLLPFFNGINHNSIVAMDNASIHHVDAAVDAICGVGALVRFLPAYSPDLNPIECVFGEVKQFLQANNLLLETPLSIPSILLMAFQSITAENI